MNTRPWFILLPCSLALVACGSDSASINPVPVADAAASDSPAETSTDAADAGDAGDESDGGDAAPGKRSLVYNSLFGDTHPENLFIDPTFSAYMPSIGNWMPMSADENAQQGATFSAGMMSDSPAGIAMNVGRLSDASSSSGNYELTVLAQVPGGPGPYHLRVWLSTLDPAASSPATWSGATVGLLISQESAIIPVDEVPGSAKVIAGRTWHLYDGELGNDLVLGGFVACDFTASTNTWLVQAPEFAPVALQDGNRSYSYHPPALARRPMTPAQRRFIELYVHRPKPSVVPWHPLLRGRSPNRLRP